MRRTPVETGTGRPPIRTTAATLARVLGAALVSVMLLAGATGSPAPAEAATARPGGARRATQTPTEPTIQVVGQTSYLPANRAFVASLRLRDAPDGSYLSTTLHRRLRSRSEFDASVATDESEFDLPTRIATFDTGPEEDLGIPVSELRTSPAADAVLRSVIPLRVPDGPRRTLPTPRPLGTEDEQTLDEAGVYPVQYRLLSGSGTVLARIVTHLVRLPTPAEAPNPATRLRVATLLPIESPPALQPDGTRASNPDAVDAVRTTVTAIADRPDLPLTLDVGAQVVETLQVDEDGSELLETLRQATTQADHQLVTTTFAGVDVSAFVNAGLTEELDLQRVLGLATLRDALKAPDTDTFRTMSNVTADAVSRLGQVGVRDLVVPESALAPLSDVYQDGIAQPFKVTGEGGVPTPALQADRRLSSSFNRNPDPVLGAHQLLAELALVARTQPDVPTGVVVVPPPRWTPDATFLRIFLGGQATANSLTTPTTVDQIFASVPPAGVNGPSAEDRGGDLVRGLTPAPIPDVVDYATDLTAERSRLRSLRSMVGAASEPSNRVADLLDVSGSALVTRGDRAQYVAEAGRTLDSQFGRITAPATEKVTLTARNARIPMSVTSSMVVPATVLVEVEASNRLEFPNGTQTESTLTAGRNRVSVRVQAPTSGDTPLQIRVYTPDRRVLLAETRYTVRSTAVSGMGLVLTLGAALFLVVWWARHWRSSKRRGRHAAADRHPTAAPEPEPLDDPPAPADPHGVGVVPGEAPDRTDG